MKIKKVKFKDTGYFSDMVLDYLNADENLKEFYKYSPELSTFKEAIANRNFPNAHRKILVDTLLEQYSRSKIKQKEAAAVFQNIALLKEENTFTLTTGHQLCLFTGPLYFIYKIVSVINLCKQLKKQYPKQNFVPVYWMATEDHDFEEIDHFRFKGEKLQWKTEQKGAVGRMSTDGLQKVYDQFSELIGDYNTRGEELKKFFKNSYLSHSNHADAFRQLVNALFANEGLVIVDGDERKLKELFAPVIKEELTKEISFDLVEKTNKKLAEKYKIQVNPREINLFYLKDGLRERIVKQEGKYLVNNTKLQFSELEILQLLEIEAEVFSPNVLLRPIYQEFVLPNLAYIGGGGELAYWFQLKSSFAHFQVPMPILFLRNSAKWILGKTAELLKQLDFEMEQLFHSEEHLIKQDTLQHSEEDLELLEEKKKIESIFHDMVQKAEKIDPTLKAFVEAKLQQTINKLESASKKFTRAEKRRNSERIDKIKKLKAELFPNKGLQERTENYATFYLAFGEELMEQLYETFELPQEGFLLFVDSSQ